jgi:MoaA/NifB/PqqE/SkfB family radical SAM enzyme
MNISSYVIAMRDRESSRNRPQGQGLLTYLEKGEKDAVGPRPSGGKPAEGARRCRVRQDGSLVVPPEVTKRLGLVPGSAADLRLERGRLEILPDIHSLARVYVEPTSRCELSCRTCLRNTWNEPTGDMEPAVFDRLVSQLGRFPALESVMFGGVGEPTLHPEIISMIKRVKALGLRAEMTTNGTRLDGPSLPELHASGLDTLWVSLDGVSAASYADIRRGGEFSAIMENLRQLEQMNARGPHRVDVGIAFVLMRRNLADLKNLDKLARTVGAGHVSVSHVLPYSAEMEKEMLCLQTLTLDTFTAAPGKTEINIPRIDVNNATKDAMFSLLQGFENLSFMGNRLSVDARRCRFIHNRCTFIRWDGKVSPCAGLLHTHRTYLYGLERTVSAYALGDVGSGDLYGSWDSAEYTRFREKVCGFDFSPCHICGGCTMLEKNEEDCYGNTFPVCGGCLWAQGIIQCP